MTSQAHRLVTEFHQVTGSAIDDRSYQVKYLRANLLREEAKEAEQALRYQGLEQIAKELADVIIVTYGAAISLGIDLDEAVAAVHRSNLTKVEGQQTREDGKVLKGPHYVPPDMAPFVKDI